MSRNDLIIVVALPSVVALVSLFFGVVLPGLRRRRRQSIPLVVAHFGESGQMPPRPGRSPAEQQAAPPAPGPGTGRAPAASVGSAVRSGAGATPPAAPPNTPEQRSARPAAAARGNLAVVSSVESAPAADWPPAPTEHHPTEAPRPRLEMITAETGAIGAPRSAALRSRPAVEGTLQFLPGRLEIVDGRDVGQEIRFVRQPGTTTTEVTFGRLEGELYRHVQLHEATVSRMHAKMTLEDRAWRLTNLSATNPVVVNAAPLEGEGTSVVLAEGDRIEMGEVVFLFRAK